MTQSVRCFLSFFLVVLCILALRNSFEQQTMQISYGKNHQEKTVILSGCEPSECSCMSNDIRQSLRRLIGQHLVKLETFVPCNLRILLQVLALKTADIRLGILGSVGKVLTVQTRDLSSISGTHVKELGTVAHACNPSTGEAEEGGSLVLAGHWGITPEGIAL